MPQSRRELLRDMMLVTGAVASGVKVSTSAAATQSSDRLLTRIAFGSCAKQDKEQPIWDAVLAKKPELFIFLGDNIYGDTEDMDVLRAKYAQLAAKPGFKRLRESSQVIATWDDHDYGQDDAGREYPMKEQSRQIFLEFWREPKESPRWQREGIYTSYTFGPDGRRVQVILPDLRYNRTPIAPLDLAGATYKEWSKKKEQQGLPVPGPYARNPDLTATMLGERQWRWLEEQFSVPADLRIVGSSLQVLADFPGWEGWTNYAHDHQRLIDIIRKQRAAGVVFISGDTHYGELSKLDVNVPYTLWDLTSSGLTEVWPVVPPNALRVSGVVQEANFGYIEVDWQARSLTLCVCDVNGAPKIKQNVTLDSLKA